jgi:hypothetical protein
VQNGAKSVQIGAISVQEHAFLVQFRIVLWVAICFSFMCICSLGGIPLVVDLMGCYSSRLLFCVVIVTDFFSLFSLTLWYHLHHFRGPFSGIFGFTYWCYRFVVGC